MVDEIKWRQHFPIRVNNGSQSWKWFYASVISRNCCLCCCYAIKTSPAQDRSRARADCWFLFRPQTLVIDVWKFPPSESRIHQLGTFFFPLTRSTVGHGTVFKFWSMSISSRNRSWLINRSFRLRIVLCTQKHSAGIGQIVLKRRVFTIIY